MTTKTDYVTVNLTGISGKRSNVYVERHGAVGVRAFLPGDLMEITAELTPNQVATCERALKRAGR